MSRVGTVLAAVTILLLSATEALAEMPQELKGSWILHAQATEDYVKTSPKWKAEDSKFLPTVIKRMSQVLYEFKDSAIIVSMRGKQQAIPVVLTERNAKRYVFEGTIRNTIVTMTVSFVDDATINIRSSTTDDMDYYLWKRGQLTNKAGADDKSLAIEVGEKVLENSSNKTDAGDGK